MNGLGKLFGTVLKKALIYIPVRKSEMNKKVFIGLFLILIGLLCNEWLLVLLFSPDGYIIPSNRYIIRGFNILCISAGILLIKYRQYKIKKIKPSSPKGVITYCIFLIIVSLVFSEVLLRILKYAPWTLWSINVSVEPGNKFFIKHHTLGYTHLPGKFKVTLNDTSYSFNVTNLSNTLSITHPLNTYPADPRKKEIWIFGCSITQGWSVNDEDTYPWIVQENLPNYEVVNFGVGGYGTLHSLIQLQEALKERKKPELVVLAYGSCHDARNTFSRKRRKSCNPRLAAQQKI